MKKYASQLKGIRLGAESVIANVGVKDVLMTMRTTDDQTLRDALYAEGMTYLIELTNINEQLVKIITEE